ncbi:MAG: heavy metal transporter [Ignavibacteria bacterium RIFOXYB2_FULL_35_12]|nr:MAG: heavy metal transporter [Ignavibacteria bacterium GWA2_36_19]OGU52164.1 MAG: heavy metal transporter [Ignavibacteria bacterium GWC2_35_8]OGU57168.1 MAG: heavy metal transporter [Ignavibacteria bacterium GWF2_35_20]OGU90798.1 MAG: heavy metal transporter [Ignavibacteria bacterium RIFOXYA12_FULL_35_25]OGU91474.1 MAG: heavy metal transporter [Ignavibacteria bacterium RIFOXYC12_FULL_35_11]OGU94456.1 MAG: heavy metal transporter [Ignavibacteria bacterium RIFOXYB12_FULL_35_14]OGV00732.1 MAG
METNKFFRNSAIVTALLASLCCITPVLAIFGGLSGIASTFSFLEPLRPYFIVFTAIILGYAFYNAYKPKKKNEIECACDDENVETKKSFINSKSFLWIVTVIAVVLITFPYYSQAFFPESQSELSANSNHIIKAKLEIEGMTCTSCEQSVDYALKSEKGVLSAESSYKTGIAFVQFDDTKVQPEQLKKAVENKVGYKVKKIQTINEKEN